VKWHFIYWWARLRNDFLRLVWFGPDECQYVQEMMAGLKKSDRKIAALLEEYENKGKGANDGNG
jgi:hypothetical protein